MDSALIPKGVKRCPIWQFVLWIGANGAVLAWGVFAMLLFGVSFKDAAGFTLASHAIQLFPVILVGLVSALITGVNIWQVSFAKGKYPKVV